jgi:hypothetical protein
VTCSLAAELSGSLRVPRLFQPCSAFAPSTRLGCATAVSAVFRLCTVHTAETAVAHQILLMIRKGSVFLHGRSSHGFLGLAAMVDGFQQPGRVNRLV